MWGQEGQRESLLEAERYLDEHPSSRPTERLASWVAPVLGEYDIVLVDCGPTLGMLTANALQFGDEIIVPMQCQRWSFTGLGTSCRRCARRGREPPRSAT